MKAARKSGMILFAILTLLGLTGNILQFKNFTGSLFDMVVVSGTVVLILAAFYNFIGYKKPHGNLLKYLMLLFAAAAIPPILYSAESGWMLLATINLVIMGGVVYVAGRLDRIDQNKYLMPLILILLIVHRIVLEISYKVPFDYAVFIGRCNGIITWLDLCVAYFLRYKEHKEAGFTDLSKKQKFRRTDK